jgi:hypothetical protein
LPGAPALAIVDLTERYVKTPCLFAGLKFEKSPTLGGVQDALEYWLERRSLNDERTHDDAVRERVLAQNQ